MNINRYGPSSEQQSYNYSNSKRDYEAHLSAGG